MIEKTKIIEFLKKNEIPAFRASQIIHAVYKEGKSSYDEMPVLPKEVRKLLTENIPILSFVVERQSESKKSDTIKALFKLKDGNFIEGVLMRFKDGRNSVCVSCQVGCGLKCAFCATGAIGLKRHLSDEEISDQVLYFNQILLKEKQKVSHVVFMGMGEPLLNYDAVMKAIGTINDPECLGIGARHITVSTSGVVPGIEKLAGEKIQFNLAVSLHAPNQKLRAQLMPIAVSYKLDSLMKAIKDYIEKTHRRVSYEYVMLKDVNDSPELARELASLVRGQLCHINLIPYNQTYLGFKNAGKTNIDKFAEIIASYDIPVTVRVSLGQDIDAACGQLSLKRC